MLNFSLVQSFGNFKDKGDCHIIGTQYINERLSAVWWCKIRIIFSWVQHGKNQSLQKSRSNGWLYRNCITMGRFSIRKYPHIFFAMHSRCLSKWFWISLRQSVTQSFVWYNSDQRIWKLVKFSKGHATFKQMEYFAFLTGEFVVLLSVLVLLISESLQRK